MKKRNIQTLSLLLALLLLLPLVPQGLFTARAAGSDFSEHFTYVSVKTQKLNQDNAPIEGDDLPTPVAQNAEVGIWLKYTLTAQLTAGTYSFSLPAAMTSLYATNGGKDIEILDGSTLLATVAVGATGDSSITFTQAAQDGGYLDNGTEGEFFIWSKLDESKIDNTTTALVFFSGSGNEKSVPLAFAPDQIGASVKVTNVGTLEQTENRIKWVVTATPELTHTGAKPGEDDQLTGFVMHNAISQNPALTVDTTTDAPVLALNGSPLTAGTDYEMSTADGLDVTLKTSHTWTASDVFTLTYYTDYDMGIFETGDTAEFTNTASASFTYPQYDGNTSSLTVNASAKTKTSANESAKVDVAAQFLAKDFSEDKANNRLNWTLTINSDKVAFDRNFNVTDAIPAGLKLVGDVKLSTDGGTASILTSAAASDSLATGTEYHYSGADYGGGTLTVNVTPGAKQVITYTTEIDPAIWQTEPSRKFKNGVAYRVEYKGTGYGFSRYKEAVCVFGGTSGGLIGASGKYNRKNHTFTWEISLNGNQTALTNGVVDIAIPDGLTYVDTPPDALTLEGSAVGSVVNAQNPKAIKVTLPSSISAAGKITLNTTVDNIEHWATNKEDTEYSITAKLTNSPGSISLSAAPIAKAETQVIKKEYTNYDFITKEITWKLTLNQNQMAMTNPVITDALIPGLTYVDGSLSATNATATNVTYAGNTLTVSLSNLVMGAASPVLTFKTLVAEDLLKPTDTDKPSKEITNTASIVFDELGSVTAPESADTKTVGKRPLIKSGDGESGQNRDWRNLAWTIDINLNQITLPNASIVDELPENLIMDPDSVKLYEANVDAAGAVTPGTLVYSGDPQHVVGADFFAVTTEEQRVTFSFLEGKIDKAYRLTFDTDNMNIKETAYTNSIGFSGEAISVGSSEPVKQAAFLAGGSMKPTRGMIQITAKKKDSPGTKLPGVRYTITGRSTRRAFSATTDANGVAIFAPLRFDEYTVTENIDGISGAGYVAVQDTPTFRVASSAPVKEAVPYALNPAIAKLVYDPSGAPPAGQPAELVRAQGSTAKVTENPYTYPGYVFDGWNTKADGSGTPYVPLTDTVTLTDPVTTLYAQWHRAKGTITLTAKNEDGSVIFPHVTLSLRPSGGGSTIQRTTDANGDAVFDVDSGKFQLVTPPQNPQGYQYKSVSKPEFTITTDGDTDSGDVIYTPFVPIPDVTLSYDGNTSTAGDTPLPQHYPRGSPVTARENPFIKEDFVFTGWNETPDGSGKAYQPGDRFAIHTSMTLYAQWKKPADLLPPSDGLGGGGGGGFGGSGGFGGGGGGIYMPWLTTDDPNAQAGVTDNPNTDGDIPASTAGEETNAADDGADGADDAENARDKGVAGDMDTKGASAHTPQTGDSFPAATVWTITLTALLLLSVSGLTIYRERKYHPKHLKRKS